MRPCGILRLPSIAPVIAALGLSLVATSFAKSAMEPSPAHAARAQADDGRSAPPDEPADGVSDLASIPFPSLENLEPAVVELLETTRRRLEEAFANESSERVRAEELGRAGMVYHAHSLREAATACYERAHALAPHQMRWLYYLALIDDDPSRRLQWFARALEVEPSHLPSLIRSARLLFDSRRLDDAEERYRRVLELAPESAAACFGLGKLAIDRKEYEKAVEHLERALELDPDATVVHYPLGLAYRNLGRMELARKHLEQRGSIECRLPDPLQAEIDALRGGMRIHQNEGATYYLQGLFVQAKASFEKAVAADPKSPLVRANLASTLVRLGEVGEAVEQLRVALDLDPNHALANFNYATLLSRFGYVKPAIAHFERALGANPDHVESRFNLANALRRVGRFADAAAAYERVTRDDPARLDAWLGCILAWAAANRYERALETAEAALIAFPQSAVIAQAAARLLAAAPCEGRDGERAFALSQRLVGVERSLDHYETMAMALAELGRFDEAIRLQRILIDRASQSGRPDLLTRLQQNLHPYNSERPCREPWSVYDETFHPKVEKDQTVPDPFAGAGPKPSGD